jgi:hypothetical protein
MSNILKTATAILMFGLAATGAAHAAQANFLAQPGYADRAQPKDVPLPHPGPWPIYDWREHQPTRYQLDAMHLHDLTPNDAREVDRLYNQLESSSARILKQEPALVQ